MVSQPSPDPSQAPWALGPHSGAPREAHELCVLFASINSLLEKVEQETWRETGISFVTSVTRLMERLLDYRYLLRNLPDLFSGHVLSPAGGSPDLKIETT